MVTARAPRFAGGGSIEFADHHYGEPGSGQLLLKVSANALCGTDRQQYSRGSLVVPGHEVAGTVLMTGPDTTTSVGSRGVAYLMDFCGTCRSCLIGATNQCLAKRTDLGFTSDGGYGPYVLLHESHFFEVPKHVDLITATLLLDVMGTSGHAIRRAQLVRPDIESVYVAGAGPIGLGLLVMTQLRLGDEVPVYVSDVSPWRLDFATTFGGVPVDANDAAAVQALPAPDVAFDATGKESARRLALDILGPRGALVCLGHGERLTLDVSADLLTPEGAVLGSEYFRYDELPENLRLLEQHEGVLSRIVTHRFGVDQIAEAFAVFLGGETGKVVVTQEDEGA